MVLGNKRFLKVRITTLKLLILIDQQVLQIFKTSFCSCFMLLKLYILLLWLSAVLLHYSYRKLGCVDSFLWGILPRLLLLHTFNIKLRIFEMDILCIQQRVLPFANSITSVILPSLNFLFILTLLLLIWCMRSLVNWFTLLFQFWGLGLENITIILFDQILQLGCYEFVKLPIICCFGHPIWVVQLFKHTEDFFYFISSTEVRTN